MLINPFGLLYHEVTASSLIKIDIEGNIVDRGSTWLGVPETGYYLHSAIHSARPELACVLHAHIPEAMAVRLRISIFYFISFHGKWTNYAIDDVLH